MSPKGLPPVQWVTVAVGRSLQPMAMGVIGPGRGSGCGSPGRQIHLGKAADARAAEEHTETVQTAAVPRMVPSTRTRRPPVGVGG